MVGEKQVFDGVEWRIRVAEGSSEVLVPAPAGLARKAWSGIKGIISGLTSKVWKFLKKAWDVGANDLRKVVHCIKVGLALTIVSMFYFMRPLYEGVGGNAMWSVMTVVVVFEPTVGATLYKCMNRICGTFLAGFLALGIHWVAGRSGERFEPFVVGASVFLLASTATFSRLIPSVKSLLDYGAMIFILTFSFIAVSGYRVDKLFELAHYRISTIIIGTSLCILVIMLVYPIWSGQQLHSLIVRNMDKLADSLEGSVTKYFDQSGEFTSHKEEDADEKLQGYKCVLISKATEETMANFARWEPSHGQFNFRHPWKQYLKVGTSMRGCAYCIEALSSCINSENHAVEFIKNYMRPSCLKVSSSCSTAIKELAETVKTMKKSSTIDFLVGEMNGAVQELQDDLKSLSLSLNPRSIPETNESETAMEATPTITVMEIIPVVTLASILIEISVRIEGLVDAVEELARLAKFATHDRESKRKVPDEKTEGTMKALQKV